MRMTRATVLTALFLIAAACWGFAQEKRTAPSPQSIGNQIVGTWKLVTIVVHHPDGTDTPDQLGPNPIGYIMYDRTGHMAVQFMRPNRPKDAPTPGYTAYFGTYTVDEQEKSVTHHIEGSLNPAGVGGNPKRSVIINGDDFRLVVNDVLTGGSQGNITTVFFSRVK
jgi:hypothetical protein